MIEREAFIQARMHAEFARWLKWAALVGAIVIFALTALDIVVYPALALRFFVYRAYAAAYLVLTAVVAGKVRDHRSLSLIGLLAVGVSAVTVEAMILQTGGHVSPYSTGMILLAVCVLAYVPGRMYFHVLAAASIIGIYVLPIIATGPIRDFRTFFLAVFFLSSIILVMLALRYLAHRSFREQASALYEVRTYGDALSHDGDEAYADPIAVVRRLREEIATRRSTEMMLEASEKKYRTLFESAPDGFYISDLAGNFIDGNRKTEEMTGYRREEVIGKNVLSLGLVPLSLVPRALKLLALTALGQATGPEEFELIAKGGGRKPIEISTYPGTIDGKRVVLGIARDITERKRTEEALRKSEERHRTILQTAMDGFWLADTQGRLLEVNKAYCRMSGYSAQELLAMRIPDLDAVESADDTAAHIQKIMAQGEDRFVSRHRRKDGSIFDIEVSVKYRSDEGGRFMGFCRDITERKKAEKDLERYRMQLESMVADRTKDLEKAIAKLNTEVYERKRAEDTVRANSAFFHGVFESIQDGIVVADVNHNIIMVNRAAEKYFCNEGTIGFKMKKCFEVLRQGTERCDNCPAVRAIEEKTTQVEIIPCKTNGAGAGWLEIYIYPLHDEHGAVMGVIHNLRDITEKCMLEERARRNDHLAALGQISAGIAHEINNPNHIISGNAELLKDVWNDADSVLSEHQALHGEFYLGRHTFSEMRERVSQMISRILNGSERITAIVNGMKQYTSQIQHGHTEKVIVNDVVRASIEMLYDQIEKTTDAFSVDLGEDIPPLLGNRQALEEVITNLVSNALQALMDRKKGVFVITRHDGKDNSIILEVRDEGQGMTSEVIRQATNPFFTTRQACGGTGLGLSISLAIVKNHNGSLDFESRPGQGTVATVRLPVGY